jgi:hypothetical protein
MLRGNRKLVPANVRNAKKKSGSTGETASENARQLGNKNNIIQD